jgi:GNAT superfamily N-acetyltransferase
MTKSENRSDALWRTLELTELDAWVDFYGAATNQVVEDCGVGLQRIGSAYASIASKVDILALNRVLCLGVAEPATETTVAKILDGYRAAGVPRFFVQLSPVARPPALPAWLQRRGFRHYNNWVKLYRGAQPLPQTNTDLRVEQITVQDGEAFAEVLTISFGWPESIRPWIAAGVDRPGWRHYLAYDGRAAVATAALYAKDGCCWLDFASTLPEYRGRGAQTALIQRRIRDGAEMGCDWFTVETAEDKPDRPAPSYHNLVRLGFKAAYLRRNYLLDADGGL